MDRAMRVLILDGSPGSRAGLRTMLAGADVNVVGETSPGPEGFTLARDGQPDVILLNLEEPLLRALKTLEAMVTNFPEVPVIAISSLASREHMRKAMLAGARDFLPKPLNRADLREALETVVRSEEKRQLFRQSRVTATPDHGSIVAVFGPKGGVGKSTLAVNLATAMAMAHQRVALIDLDVDQGADAMMLNLTPHKGLIDLPAGLSQSDPELLKSYMTEHPSGLHLLAAPTQLISPRDGGLPDLQKLLETMSSTYEYVVVDTPSSVNEHVRVVLRSATYVLVVTSLEIPSISVVKRHLDTMRGWEFARDKIKVVMNVPNCSNSVKKGDIEEFLDVPVFWSIPNDPKVGEANQHGTPLVETSPRSKAAEAITALHYTLTGLKPESHGAARLLKPLGLGRR
ncbi:MAG: AAA family ATPase [Chloroflexi bacterium]|nr:AAA family ATPase [Chloroflexota bacterium]